MNRLRIKRYLRYVFWAAFVLFIVNKFALRPFVLDHDLPAWSKVVVLSVPNTCEAIIGMILVAGLLMAAKFYWRARLDGIPDLAVYLLAFAVAGTYVVTQESKLHNLGGNNTYDPYDVVASVIGLIGMLLLFCRFGVREHAVEAPPPGSFS